jgi:hypothetical protein
MSTHVGPCKCHSSACESVGCGRVYSRTTLLWHTDFIKLHLMSAVHWVCLPTDFFRRSGSQVFLRQMRFGGRASGDHRSCGGRAMARSRLPVRCQGVCVESAPGQAGRGGSGGRHCQRKRAAMHCGHVCAGGSARRKEW